MLLAVNFSYQFRKIIYRVLIVVQNRIPLRP